MTKGWYRERKRHSEAAKRGARSRRLIKRGLSSKPFSPMPKLDDKDEHLEYFTAVIVPSTEGDKPISRKAFRRRINETRRKMSELFGGYTSIEAIGGWVDNNKLIKEDTARVISYADKAKYERNQRAFLAWLKKKKGEWKQYYLSYEFETDLFLL